MLIGKNNKGFSLLEVLVALSILSVAVFSIVRLFPFGMNATKQSEQKTLAVNFAQAKIEELISQGYEQINVGTVIEESLSTIDNDFSEFKRITRVKYLDSSLNETQTDLGLKLIETDIVWINIMTGENTTLTIRTLNSHL
ncbi:prepilin-type N-terminal cleavage/methylation domain-containing protein [bacterium]|jgi:type II secretion system protein I|nr:prepilin-type N-terminal cleavage/methylation domain-containing protein [bacterium]MBT4121597.1 prepilin-type N-terminal cleavage/methylation domain-containing protein [bacterium]MBT4335091.1 prepilin-type N-terminal cleavage/methylation domain-containing protein [bacterium]MBT4495621.1 prepilin-type N-terminal cleavage/methylation domain-containing protein [bacterium]MBT4764095.1 prepilin-type N-terminal cleavage/methylation domain-containing protein [bacterium]